MKRAPPGGHARSGSAFPAVRLGENRLGPGSGRVRVSHEQRCPGSQGRPGAVAGRLSEMRGTLGAWKCPTSRVVGCLARWWVRSSGQEGTSLSQASLGHPGRAIPRRESAQQPRRAVVVTWRTRVSPSPPSSGPRRASGRAWGAPDVSFLFYSYSPAGASLLGALLSGTNSPSAPVRSSVRRRARGRKGEWPQPGCGPAARLCPGGLKSGLAGDSRIPSVSGWVFTWLTRQAPLLPRPCCSLLLPRSPGKRRE